MTPRARFRLRALVALMAGCAALGVVLLAELESSPLQSLSFTRLADEFAVTVEPDINNRARFPGKGPYDVRLGYAQIPEFLDALKAQGFRVDSQARLSPALESFIDLGGFPIYKEKSQAGLRISIGPTTRFTTRAIPSTSSRISNPFPRLSSQLSCL